MKVKPIFAWYDCWVGWYWDEKKRYLYIFPLPMFGIRIEKKSTEPSAGQTEGK